MDLSDPSNTTLPSSLSSNVENSMLVPSSKRTRFLATYQRQVFLLPKTIMYYVVKNPSSPEYYQKIIKTCKYFFVQNPIIFLHRPLFNGFELKKWGYRGWEPCTNVGKSKFWIIRKFRVRPKPGADQNAISLIMPKIFRFDIRELRISNQNISYKDFVNLVSTAKRLNLCHVTVQDENGSHVSIEKLLETSSKAEKFIFLSNTVLSYITPKTFGELLKLPNFLQLDYFALGLIPEAFDIEAFYAFMKKNQRTYFSLYFDASISQAYENRLAGIIDEILVTKNPEYRIPYIRFPGGDGEKFRKLFRLANQEAS